MPVAAAHATCGAKPAGWLSLARGSDVTCTTRRRPVVRITRRRSTAVAGRVVYAVAVLHAGRSHQQQPWYRRRCDACGPLTFLPAS